MSQLTGTLTAGAEAARPVASGDAVTGAAASGLAAEAAAADAVAELYSRYQSALLHVAAGYVGSLAVAEDVVQDTLLGAIVGISRFDHRSSLKTWVFRILENIAKTRARREARTVPFSSITERAPGGPADPLFPGLHQRRALWGADRDSAPDSPLLLGELSRLMIHAIDALPPRERAVITLRAIHGCSPEEVCRLLRISDTSQRSALHRARSKIRAWLSPYLMMERT